MAPEFGEQALHSPSRENALGRQQNNQKTSRLWRKFHCRNKVIRCPRADRPGSAAAAREAAFPDLVLLESALKRGYPGLFPSTRRLFRAIRGLHRVTSNSSGRFLILSGSSLTGNARFQALPRRLQAPNCQDAALSRHTSHCAHFDARPAKVELSSRSVDARSRCAEARSRRFAASNRFLEFYSGDWKRHPVRTEDGIGGWVRRRADRGLRRSCPAYG